MQKLKLIISSIISLLTRNDIITNPAILTKISKIKVDINNFYSSATKVNDLNVNGDGNHVLNSSYTYDIKIIISCITSLKVIISQLEYVRRKDLSFTEKEAVIVGVISRLEILLKILNVLGGS